MDTQVDTREQTVDTSPPMPDELVDVIVWGNMRLPQMYFAQNALAGEKICALVSSGKTTWGEIDKMKPTPNQIKKVMEAAEKVHAAYGVTPDKIHGDFDTESINSILLVPKRNALGISNWLADRLVQSGIGAKNPRFRMMRFFQRKEELPQNRISRLTKFFASPKYSNQKSIFMMMWHEAAEFLKSESGKELTHKVREEIKRKVGQTRERILTSDTTYLNIALGMQKRIAETPEGKNLPKDLIEEFTNKLQVFA